MRRKGLLAWRRSPPAGVLVLKMLAQPSLQTTANYLNFTNVHIQDEIERKR
jgi:hypothetical protein